MIHNVDPQLSQWDVGRSVSVSDSEATHIHFANQGDSKAVIIEIENGSAKIPDYLLQTGKTVIAYAVYDGITMESKSFAVRKRERPENYVYEDDQRNYIYELITDVETAVANATLATERATTATNNANIATTNANTAAVSANEATGKAILATTSANEAATKAINAVKNMMVVGEAKGESIYLDDAIDQTLVGLRVFGKTTQDGTPTPDAPVELVSVGESGSITVNVTGENDAKGMTIATPNGLPGIPVASGGNYTDANGQQWVCDEIDFARGVRIQRIGKWIIDGAKVPTTFTPGNNGGTVIGYLYTDVMNGISTNRMPKMCDKIKSPTATYIASYKDCEVGFWYFNTTGGTTPDIFLIFNLGDFSSTDEAVSYLQTNPLTFIGILATPIETPLSEEELSAYAALHTYKDNTTVSNDAGAWMELEYVMDAKKYLNDLVTGTILPARVE